MQEETNILQESMEEEIDGTVSSLDEKDDEESEEQKEEERISYPCPPSNECRVKTGGSRVGGPDLCVLGLW